MKFFLLLIILPIIEIVIFIKVGDLIGVLYTILIILITGIIGLYLIKNHSLLKLLKISQETFKNNDYTFENIGQTLIIVISGLLLIFPGFISDIFGFLLLIPKIRNKIIFNIIKRTKNKYNDNNIVIDVDHYEEKED
tara:strand:+ start:844 stop:1254 length:411 start_codon:yes stop_codon:yes gene_type:complete